MVLGVGLSILCPVSQAEREWPRDPQAPVGHPHTPGLRPLRRFRGPWTEEWPESLRSACVLGNLPMFMFSLGQ